MVQITVRKLGESLGVILPGEAAKALHVEEGDVLYLSESPAGYMLTPFDPEFQRGMAVAENVMKRYRNALRELAK